MAAYQSPAVAAVADDDFGAALRVAHERRRNCWLKLKSLIELKLSLKFEVRLTESHTQAEKQS